MLDISELTVRYGKLTALDQVDIRVAGGEAVFVVGPNGAGKSTLLKTISGLLRPASGGIGFEGSDIAGVAPEKLCQRGLALVPEGRHIFRTLTVEENLLVGMMIRRDKAAAKQDLERILQTFPILRDRFRGVAGNLSGGEQQQLAIARALLQRPRLLMIDEPSLGLAPLVIDQVYASLKDLNAAGLTLLVVEQSTARVLDLATRVYVLRSGKVVLSDSAEALATGNAMEEAYFGYAGRESA
ncbi:MAG: ABC transporter ATP-binding protein [Pararhodobacter sp.]|nr:ABC transporter ATP-binding protein [Pararhodobacter sp.]